MRIFSLRFYYTDAKLVHATFFVEGTPGTSIAELATTAMVKEEEEEDFQEEESITICC